MKESPRIETVVLDDGSMCKVALYGESDGLEPFRMLSPDDPLAEKLDGLFAEDTEKPAAS